MRIHHTLISCALLIGAVLPLSCDRTEVELPLTEASFSAVVDQSAQTKGTPVESADAFKTRIEMFTIWGFMNGDPINGASNNFFNRPVRMFGSRYFPVRETSDGEGHTIWDWDHIGLPGGLTRENEMFYGLADDGYGDVLNVTGTSATGGITFSYQAHEPYVQDNLAYFLKDAEAIGEILAGVLTSGGVNEDGIIPLVFSHPLASVRFRIGQDVNKTFSIDKISFNGVLTSGVCNFYRDAATKDIVMNWSNVGTPQSYTQTYNFQVTPHTSSNTEVNNAQLRQAWFMVPQSFGSTSTSTIDITYTVYGTQHTTSIPLKDVTWNANNEYWYTINKNGVVFETSVGPWQEGVKDSRMYMEDNIYW